MCPFVQCPSAHCVICNEMAMQLVINYKSVYRFDVSFLYVDKYIFAFLAMYGLCGGLFPAPFTVQIAILGIVIAVFLVPPWKLQKCHQTFRNFICSFQFSCCFFARSLVFDPIYFCQTEKKRILVFFLFDSGSFDRRGSLKIVQSPCQWTDRNKSAFLLLRFYRLLINLSTISTWFLCR